MMGVKTLVASKLPPHPNFPGEDGAVPCDRDTGEQLLRFLWDKPGSHPLNAEALGKINEGVRTFGPHLHPECALVLPSVLPAHLAERVAKKYRYLHLSWSAEHHAEMEDSGGADGIEQEEDIFADEDDGIRIGGDGSGPAAPQAKRKGKGAINGSRLMPRSMHNSRVTGVSLELYLSSLYD